MLFLRDVIIGVLHRFIHFQSWATNIGSPLHAETLSMLFQKQTIPEGSYEPLKNRKKLGAASGFDTHQLYRKSSSLELWESEKIHAWHTTSGMTPPTTGYSDPAPRSCISSWTRSPWGQCLSRSRPQRVTRFFPFGKLAPPIHVLGDDVFVANFSLGMCGLLHLLEMPKFLFTLWGSLSFLLSTNKYTSKNKAKTMHLKVKHTFLKNSRLKKQDHNYMDVQKRTRIMSQLKNTIDGSELLLTSWGWQFIPLFTRRF